MVYIYIFTLILKYMFRNLLCEQCTFTLSRHFKHYLKFSKYIYPHSSMLFHRKRLVRFIDFHHLSTLFSISCTYTPCNVCAHIYMYGEILIHIHIKIGIYALYIYIYIYMYVCMYICMYIYMIIYIYMGIYVHVCVYIYMYIYV